MPKEIQNRASKDMSLRKAIATIREVSKSTSLVGRAEAQTICRDLEAIENDLEALAVIYKTGKVPR